MRLFIYRHHSISLIFFKFENISFYINSTNIHFFKLCNLPYTMFWVNHVVFNLILLFFCFLFFNFFYFRFLFVIFRNTEQTSIWIWIFFFIYFYLFRFYTFVNFILSFNFFSFWLLSVIPSIHFAPTFAIGIPMDFETKGTVLDALGLTSRTNISSPFTANWTFLSLLH